MGSVALPIENKVRELDGKLWLGLNFVNNGYNITIGPSWELKSILNDVNTSIYFSKDPGDGNIDFFKKLDDAGITVCGLAPEVGVNSSTASFANNRQDVLNHLDIFFAWGNTTANALRQLYYDEKTKNKIKVTGNPRFDLVTKELRSIYSPKAMDLKEQYGDYFLLNTNFGMGNPVDRKRTYDKVREIHPERDPYREGIHESRVFHSFVELVLYLLEKDMGESIIIRPHPGEDHSAYFDIFEPYDSVHVEHYGDVRSWIVGANGVIHYDCTTGVEAALMEKPVLSYQTVTQESNPKPLSQIVSREAESRDEVVRWINEYSSDNKSYVMNDEQKEKARGYFPNMDELAAPKIFDIMDSLEPKQGTNRGYETTVRENVELSIKSSRFGPEAISLYDAIRDSLLERDYQKKREKQKQKFSGLNKNELVEKINLFSDFIEPKHLVVDSVTKTRHTYTIRSF